MKFTLTKKGFTPLEISKSRNRRRFLTGFTLLEILIVAAVIVTIAAIAIPIVISYRINANEGAALANLKMLHGVLTSYAAANNGEYPSEYSYPTGQLYSANPRYLNDPTFGIYPLNPGHPMGGGTKQGYIYWFYQNYTWRDGTFITSTKDFMIWIFPSSVVDSSSDPNVMKFRGRRSFLILSNGQILWKWYYEQIGAFRPLE